MKNFYKHFHDEIWAIIGIFISSLLYTISIRCFIQPSGQLLSGGASGIAIIISRKFFASNETIAYSIVYVLINLPLFLIGFRRVGKEFCLFSFLNVLLTSFFIGSIPQNFFPNIDLSNDLLATALFAGIFSGASAGIALKLNSSTGGIDILSAYIATKTGKSLGSYMFYINGAILLSGGIILNDLRGMLYTVVYIFMYSQITNIFHRRNNKKLLKIISDNKDDIVQLLCVKIHHGVTITQGEGAYTHKPHYILESVVREDQVKEIIKSVYEIDPNAFLTIQNVETLKGRFYMPKIK
ncbi:MAG: YitT family protein [Bacilli bacterium]|nr:YitT family protein [Bacilli bacterium]